MPTRRYDKNYFDKWYRDPKHRVVTAVTTARKAAIAVAMAEYYLERPVRNVLDVGCGEGQWRAALRKLRPRIRYTGIDSSPYVVQRFGKRRNILLGSFGELGRFDLDYSYDLIVCSDLLYYVPTRELSPGLQAVAAFLGGVAFLEIYPSDMELEGDSRGIERRGAAVYTRLLRKYGLVSCGTHCYAGPALADRVTALERGGV